VDAAIVQSKTSGARLSPRGVARSVERGRIGRAGGLITVEEICYFQADSKYTMVVTAEHESLIRKPIKELLAQLDPEMFWQIHRSTVVNVNAIAALHRTMAGNYEVRLKQRKESLPVSAPYAHLFKQM
jgi:DNA-binding LytR/AlgR family response regulator